MKVIHPIALFRSTVLGPLISRDQLPRGDLKSTIKMLASHSYNIPGSRNNHLSEKTIEAWYYAWRRGGIEALTPKSRSDRGQSKISPAHQEAILATKRENPRRSIDRVIRLLERRGEVAKDALKRASVHRLLQANGLSRPTGAPSEVEEHRAYLAEFAGDIWYGDVMHGPKVPVDGTVRKVYLVSLMDDASRLITHSAFCLGETALDIEGVLKQAILKRGLPKKLVIDNGPAYRAKTLQEVCLRLGIHLIYCRPYAPEGKGKLERWHRTFRDHFLTELDHSRLSDLSDLNARLWAWVESIYHRSPHRGLGLDGDTPLQRYQRDLAKIRTLGVLAGQIDELFYHRVARKVRKDGTVPYRGIRFEVPYEHTGKQVVLVVDPHSQQVIGVEDDQGKSLGAATALDAVANVNRKRRKPQSIETSSGQPADPNNEVEMAYRQYHEHNREGQ
jgi:putative transposase